MRETDVNVGGPDGPRTGEKPPLTVGTVMVPYDGDDSRRWLWERLDEVRVLYERRYRGPKLPQAVETRPGQYEDPDA